MEPKYHVAPAEPGSGKSKGIQGYLRLYLDGGRSAADTGIIVIVTRIEEILSYIAGAKLDTNEYSVLASGNQKQNLLKFGGRSDVDNAKVLFITAQRLSARPSDFSCLKDLFYKGKPRALRLWDEEFTIASQSSVSLDQIKALPSTIRAADAEATRLVEDLEAIVSTASNDDEITVPAGLAAALQRTLNRLDLKAPDRAAVAANSLIRLSGKSARVAKPTYARGLGRGATCPSIIGEGSRYAADLAPVFIFDASARVNGAYEIMERDGVPIEKYVSRDLSYFPVTFHHMKMGAGRITMGKEAERKLVLLEAAEVINVDEDECLVIYNRLNHHDVEKSLRALCKNPARLKFVYWGDHRAKNDFRYIKKVIVIGLLRYPAAGYEAKRVEYGAAAAFRDTDLSDIRNGELRSAMLQAFARSNIRNHDEFGRCGECNVYVLDSERDLEAYLRDTFPGCRYAEWKRVAAKKLGKTNARIAAYIMRLDDSDLRKSISRSIIYRALKMDKSNFSKAVRDPDLTKYLADYGIVVSKSAVTLY